MKKFKKENRCLLKYIIYVLMCLTVNIFFPLTLFKYFLLIILLLLIIFEKNENCVYLVFFFHPLSGLFDSIGFKHTYNIIIFLVAFKLLLKRNFCVDKKLILAFFAIFLYDVLLELLYGKIDFGLLSLFSWVASYLLVIVCIADIKNINSERLFKFFFFGFLCSILLTYSDVLVSLENMRYRYAGLLRDPNAYAVDAIILMYFSICLKSRISWIYILIFLLGLLSVSKMFVIVSLFGLFLYVLMNVSKIKFINVVRMIMLIIAFSVAIARVPQLQYSIDKYYQRFTSSSLLSSRDTIQKIYIDSIKNKPLNFVIGGGLLNYNVVFNTMESNTYVHYAHNTYFDLIFSWGLIGSTMYLFFTYLYNSTIKRRLNYVREHMNKYSIILLICFLMIITTLSYLSADTFILDVFLILFLMYSDNYYNNERVNDINE